MNLAQSTKYQRRSIIILYDAICVLVAYYSSYALRYESLNFNDYKNQKFLEVLVINFIVQISIFFIMGLHRGLWRFASTKDLILILKTVSLAIATSLLITFQYSRLEFTPRSIFVLDWILLLITLGGGRFLYRMIKQQVSIKHTENAILIGAGVAGEQLIREFAKHPKEIGFNISAVLDDNASKHGRTIHGVRIKGNLNSLPNTIKTYKASMIFIAIPTANNKTIRKIYDLAKPSGVTINTLPPIVDLISGKVSFKQMREVQVEDLMGRNIANLDLNTIAHKHRNKVVLITGAGGSIGSELCRQVLQYNPSKLIVLDNSEFNIYKIAEELSDSKKKFTSELIFKTVSVTDEASFEAVFRKYRPDTVYHAAAYKHVPIMEMNPRSAIKTNILGTKIASELSIKYDVKKFILVSTDKAVNPTNVMGATKRIAEMTCEFYQRRGETKFSMVRFGNVLGSSGSVIPKFKKQILEGGPVTVTHPDITRFFMAIPEAAQLVIQAGCIANGGEIFILNMGNPVKISELAKELITLSGYTVDTEIKIEYTGLRPGEKLYEELLADNESTLPTSHEMVRVAKTRSLPENFNHIFNSILNLNQNISRNEIKMLLHSLVTEYRPQLEKEEVSTRELQ